METVNVPMQRFRDSNGEPTCLTESGACKFLRAIRIGSTEICAIIGSGNLRRRSKGNGTIIPHGECPIWSVDRDREIVEMERLRACRQELREVTEAMNDPAINNTISLAEAILRKS